MRQKVSWAGGEWWRVVASGSEYHELLDSDANNALFSDYEVVMWNWHAPYMTLQRAGIFVRFLAVLARTFVPAVDIQVQLFGWPWTWPAALPWMILIGQQIDFIKAIDDIDFMLSQKAVGGFRT